MGTMTSPSSQPQAKAAAAPALIRFTRGAFAHTEPFDDRTLTVGTSAVQYGPVDIVSYGYARSILMDVQVTSTGNAATVALAEDAPWSLIADFRIADVNGAPLFGPLSGYEMYLVHKYGGYRSQQDPKLFPDYTALTTGAGGTAGSGRFFLRIPIEFNERTAMGSLANMNAAATYKISGTFGPTSLAYTTPPTNAVSVRVKLYLEAWSQPDAFDVANRPQATQPPGNGTTQYWSRQIISAISLGANTVRHSRVGNYIRNQVYIFRSSSSRSTGQTNLPPDWVWYLDSRTFHSIELQFLRAIMSERFGFVSLTAEAAGGPDNGVIVLPFNFEFDGRAGYEVMDQWVPTTQATRFELQASFGAAGTLNILTNDVAPRGEIFA